MYDVYRIHVRHGLNFEYVYYNNLSPQRFASKRFFQKGDAKRYWRFLVCVLVLAFSGELLYWLVNMRIAFALIIIFFACLDF